jgi:hypothetical protein
MTATPAPAPSERSAIKLWGSPSQPKWSTTVYLGDSREELKELVEVALDIFNLVGERHAARRQEKRPVPTVTVHVPQRPKEQV